MKTIYNVWNSIIQFKINVLKLFLINKKSLFVLTLSLTCLNSYSQVNFCESFDSALVAGDPIAQTSSSWNTWGELMTGANPNIDDAIVDGNLYYSAPNCLSFDADPSLSLIHI